MHTLTYEVNGEVGFIDVETIQEANHRIAVVEQKYNIPGNKFRWTHPISEQMKGLEGTGQLLCE